jgi:hypothetical protein
MSILFKLLVKLIKFLSIFGKACSNIRFRGSTCFRLYIIDNNNISKLHCWLLMFLVSSFSGMNMLSSSMVSSYFCLIQYKDKKEWMAKANCEINKYLFIIGYIFLFGAKKTKKIEFVIFICQRSCLYAGHMTMDTIFVCSQGNHFSVITFILLGVLVSLQIKFQITNLV